MTYKKVKHLKCVSCGEFCGEPETVDTLYCEDCDEHFEPSREKDHTKLWHSTPCGKCWLCKDGKSFICETPIIE